VNGDEARFLVASGDYHGGSIDARGGQLHPLNRALGIARAAAANGAHLHAHTKATAIERVGSAWRIQTATGSVSAPTVLLACGGCLRGLDQDVEARVIPINNYVAVTAPFGSELAATMIRNRLAVSDSRFVIYYYRMTPDYRLLLGGGESYSHRFLGNIAAFVLPHLARVFPLLADVPIDHAWGGTLSITASRLPSSVKSAPASTMLAACRALAWCLHPISERSWATRSQAACPISTGWRGCPYPDCRAAVCCAGRPWLQQCLSTRCAINSRR
jgi:gamma-glutamylputrescine oxidase